MNSTHDGQRSLHALLKQMTLIRTHIHTQDYGKKSDDKFCKRKRVSKQKKKTKIK